MNSAVAAQLLPHPKILTSALLMVISEKKRFLKRCCISVIIRHD